MGSFVLTWIIKRYALVKNIMDCPNDRSSHLHPTPRGGGIAFIVAFGMGSFFLGLFGYASWPFGVLIATGFVAMLGFLDDKGHVPARIRLVGHFGACLMALYCLGGMPTIYVGSWVLSSGMLLNGFTVILLVWLLNLYNFMDGIDGIAGMEAISVCLGGALLFALQGNLIWIGLPLVLAASVAGFLIWNWPPARIFMGDAGSGCLGLVLGLLMIQATRVNPVFFWSWMVLLGVFVVDASVTLLCRMAQRATLYLAHRDHAYQHAARSVGDHRRVTLLVTLINMSWLLPIAIFIGIGKLDGYSGLFMAYCPLIVLAIALRAGRDP